MAKRCWAKFEKVEVKHILREQNVHIDGLVGTYIALNPKTERSMPLLILRQLVTETEQAVEGEVAAIDNSGAQMEPPSFFLQGGELLVDKDEAAKVQRRAARFMLIEGKLYKRAFSRTLLKCLTKGQAQLAMAEVHEGSCDNYGRGRSLARQLIRTRFFWPTMQKDSSNYVQRCDLCQRFETTMGKHTKPLHTIIPTWPFMKQGMYIVGKLPRGSRQKVYAIFVTDYFTKWVERETLARI